jgi:hypothetical protein
MSNRYDEPWPVRFTAVVVAILGLVTVAFVFFAMILSALRSDGEQSELEAARAAAEAERQTQYEINHIQPRVVGAVSRLYYVQDSRTGICFAARSVGHFGMLAHVPCEDIPEDMLLTTDLE